MHQRGGFFYVRRTRTGLPAHSFPFMIRDPLEPSVANALEMRYDGPVRLNRPSAFPGETPLNSLSPLPERSYEKISRNRRKILREAYACYPEYAYCDPEVFDWHTEEGRANLFDLYYLNDSGLIQCTGSTTTGHRRPDFFMLTPAGADLLEIPGRLDERFPVG